MNFTDLLPFSLGRGRAAAKKRVDLSGAQAGLDFGEPAKKPRRKKAAGNTDLAAKPSNTIRALPKKLTKPIAGEAGTVNGEIQRVRFFNPDNGYAILGTSAGETVVGTCSDRPQNGMRLSATGQWVSHDKYGLQLKADTLNLVATTKAHRATVGLGKFLVHICRGVGDTVAERLLEAYPAEDLIHILDTDITVLVRDNKVKGLKRDTLAELQRVWEPNRGISTIYMNLLSIGMSVSKIEHTLEKFGDRALAIIKENPYKLTEVDGIGFLTADKFAQNLGLAYDSPYRIRAAAAYMFKRFESEGCCAVPQSKFVAETAKLLELPAARIAAEVQVLINDNAIVQDLVGGLQACLFSPVMYRTEQDLAKRLNQLMRHGSHASPEERRELEATLDALAIKDDVTLSNEQRAAVIQTVSSPLAVITGFPGTGKSTVARYVVQLLQMKQRRIALCAPTGKAAKRLTETVGGDHIATTIHRLLGGGNGRYEHHEDNPLTENVVLVDEPSMLDVYLCDSLVRALPHGAQLIFLGDVDQLPSVGPGRVLHDMIESGVIPVSRLTEVFRQAKGSAVWLTAKAFRDGAVPVMPNEMGGDFAFRPIVDAASGLAELDAVLNSLESEGYNLKTEVQVLTPMNVGTLGVTALNLHMQQRLNPGTGGLPLINGSFLRAGDRVLQTKNNYNKDVFNGEQGTVMSVSPSEAIIVFQDNPQVYSKKDLDTVQLAYATTVHKAQGAEYPAVVLFLTSQHYMLQQRNLLYTAVTRGRKKVVLIGDLKSIQRAVDNAQMEDRWSKLCDWLRISAYA